MLKSTQILLGIILTSMIVSVTILTALGKDPGQVIELLTTAIIPTVVALFAADKAGKAQHAAQESVLASNGRMRELIQLLRDAGGTVPDKYADIDPLAGDISALSKRDNDDVS